MTVRGPKVRDFTDQRRHLPVTVDADPVYEVLLALFLIHDGNLDEYSEASTLIERLDAGDDATLRTDLTEPASCGVVWLSLLGIAHDLPAPRSVARLADSIEHMDATELRRLMLRNSGFRPDKGHAEEVLAAVAAGDPAAIDEVFEESYYSDLRYFMAMQPDEMAHQLASLLRRFDAAVGGWLGRVGPILERDAASTRAMARTMSPARLVEKATNGITFEMQPQVSGILLIPSVIVRPWVVISEHGTLRVFCYSIADEVLEGDLDAPPAYMVEVFKALGDERRLRILGVLADGPLGLKDVADRVDLAKSTAHHHLRILRSAGLVRVTIGGDDKRYSLRTESVPEVSRLLEGFLDRPPVTERKDTA